MIQDFFGMSVGAAVAFVGTVIALCLSACGMVKMLFIDSKRNGNGNGQPKLSVGNNSSYHLSDLMKQLDNRFDDMQTNMEKTENSMNKNFEKIFLYIEGDGTQSAPGINARLFNIEKMAERNEQEHKEIFERLRVAKF